MAYLWDINTGYATMWGKYKTEREIPFIKKHLPDRKMKILDIRGGEWQVCNTSIAKWALCNCD